MKRSLEYALMQAGIDPRKLPPGTLVDGKPIEEEEAKEKRPKRPRMTKTEAAWQAHLDWLVSIGKVRAYRFHPGSLRMTDPDPQTGYCRHYQPDFMVILTNSDKPWMLEIKGRHVWEDAAVKFDQARETLGWAFHFAMVQKRGGDWSTIRGEDWLE